MLQAELVPPYDWLGVRLASLATPARSSLTVPTCMRALIGKEKNKKTRMCVRVRACACV